MLATEVLEGGSRDHYFDEYRNRGYLPPEPERDARPVVELPPIDFRLELIRRSDGTLEWVE